MEEKAFVWTPELNKCLIQFRIEHDWLFKTKKQPWGEFYKILIDSGFPIEMTINHVRKKWSYMYDTYKIAKKAKNKNWKYYKLFEKLYGRTKILDKYESSADIESVFILQKRAIRAIYNLRPRDSLRDVFKEEVFKESNILTVASQYILENIMYVKKHSDTFVKKSDVHSFNTRCKAKLIVPNFRLYKTSSSFMGSCVKIYNKIPSVLTELPYNHFKAHVKGILMTKVYYKLDEYFKDEMPGRSDEWRLKLIASISEAKAKKLDYREMWKSVEKALRTEELPVDCCIQDIKGLWQHIRMTFNRKHRLKLKKGAELTDWPPYEPMASYFNKFEPDYLIKLESESGNICMSRERKSSKYYLNKNEKTTEQTIEFQWSKDITESFIQIRLQNDWLFRERKWAWNDLLAIMREEYGFPSSLTGRDICRKWASTFSEYQKAKATNNKLWVYHKLFEVYLGEGNLSLDPTIGWEKEWIFNLISIRSDHENLFRCNLKDQTNGWREVEKRLRKMGLPLDHSLLELPEVWAYMLKTYRWKRKFADKGILNEQWPFYEAMAAYKERHGSKITKTTIQKQKLSKNEDFDDCGRPSDDETEEDMKLTDLKQKLQVVKPKVECSEVNNCRTCYVENGCLNIFSNKDEEGIDLAEKLRVICGVEVDAADSLPSQICLECARALEFAFKFRRKCQDSDAKFKSEEIVDKIKTEIPPDEASGQLNSHNNVQSNFDPGDSHFDDPPSEPEATPGKKAAERKKITKPKKVFKLKYHYWKVCEVCGKYTKNLMSHLDTHSNSKEHACNVCDKKFKFRSGLLIHKAVHDPTPKKTCEVCGKTFHVLAQYRKHFVYHANERKYSCDTCGKRFNTLDILRVHNRIHTDERPFACGECGKTFRTAGCVSRHKRIVHRNVKVY